MSSSCVICIRDCPIQDSIFNIKHSLEHHSICQVRKIFATKYWDSGNNEPSKKLVYIWVEWRNTNASGIFTTRLNHHGEASLFKLDRWDKPICTNIDDSGNEIAHENWTVTITSRENFIEDEIKFGTRDDEEIWQIYLAPGESFEDPDEEQEDEQQILTLRPVLEIPKLKRNSKILPTVEACNNPTVLSLFMTEEVEEEMEILNKEENDAFIRENLNIVETQMDWSEYKKYALSKEELKKLSKGEINYNYIYINDTQIKNKN